MNSAKQTGTFFLYISESGSLTPLRIVLRQAKVPVDKDSLWREQIDLLGGEFENSFVLRMQHQFIKG